MAVQGHVDQMEGAYVTGWAIAMPDTGDCAITVADSQGKVLAKDRASRHREDIAALGLGRPNLAFRVAVPHGAGRRQLHVLANGQELGGSPISIGAGLFDGKVAVEQDQVTGWVSERIAGFAAPFITVVNHLAVEVGRGQSEFSADDAGPAVQPGALRHNAGRPVFRRGRDAAHAACQWRGVCRHLLPPSPDRESGRRLGHALRRLAALARGAARVFALEIYRNGKLAGEARNDVERDDVSVVHLGAVDAGF